MSDKILQVEQRVVQIIHSSKQGLPGPPGPAAEGLDPDQQAALEAANAPDGDNPFATQLDLVSKKVFHGIKTSGIPTIVGTTVTLPGPVEYYYQGTFFASTPAITYEIAAPVIGTRYFVFFASAAGTLTHNTTGHDYKTMVPVCVGIYNGSTWAVEFDCHNHTHDLDWHVNEHATEGTAYDAAYAGGAGSFSSSDFSITRSRVLDEDIIHDLLTDQTTARIWYQSAAGIWTFEDAPVSVAAKIVAGALKYDADGVLTSVTAGYFCRNDIYHTSHRTTPLQLVVGQGQYLSSSEAKFAPTRRPPFFIESKRYYRTIWQNNAGTPTFIDALDWRTTPDTSLPQQVMATVVKPAASKTLVAGQAETGNLSDTASDNGVFWTLNEASANPALTEEITFAVTSPVTSFIASSYYTGTGTGFHIVDWKVWDFLLAAWTVLGQVPIGSEVFQTFALDDTRHRSGGIVKIRVEHRAGVGNTSHDVVIDYLGIVQTDYRSVADIDALKVDKQSGVILGQRDRCPVTVCADAIQDVTFNFAAGNSRRIDASAITGGKAVTLLATNFPTAEIEAGVDPQVVYTIYLKVGAARPSFSAPAGWSVGTLLSAITQSKTSVFTLDYVGTGTPTLTLYREY